MKAVIWTAYGSPDVLKIQDIPKPTPKDKEILVKIHATPVNFGDTFARKFNSITPRTFSMPSPLWLMTRLVFGIRKPRLKILGSEFSGVVEAVGKDVTRLKPGDAVFGYRAMNFGANAEYLVMPEKGLVMHKPENMSYEEIATVPYGAITALNLLRKVNIKPGMKILINGASGSIGSYAVQFAKYYGAEVTGVCGTPRMAMVRTLGADHVIDYTKEDFTKNGQKYDLILDVLAKSSFSHVKNSLTERGIYMLASFKFKHLFQMVRTMNSKGKRVICALSAESVDDLTFIKELVEQGKLTTVIDRTFPLERTADAHRYAESGSKTGSVVITVGA